MSAEQLECPDHIAVIGGGRWARVLTEVLCTIITPPCRITVYTPHNLVGMLKWTSHKALQDQVTVTSVWPEFVGSEINAAIVVNAARDHEMVVTKLLLERIPVLVEKPVTLTGNATRRLINLASANNTYLAAAHIFLYASYHKKFAELVLDKTAIRKLIVNWIDPELENRYGENKQYDPGLTVVSDWFPHILSILSLYGPGYSCNIDTLGIQRGGAAVDINMEYGNISCQIHIERNGASRQRLISVITDTQSLQLDYSVEPGIVKVIDQEISGDKDWQKTERPSALMLKAFLKGVCSGPHDSRLDIHRALSANEAIDKVMTLYRSAQIDWLSNNIDTSSEVDENLEYAIGEILQADGLLTSSELSVRFEKLIEYFADSADNTHLIQSWIKSDSPKRFFDKNVKKQTADKAGQE